MVAHFHLDPTTPAKAGVQGRSVLACPALNDGPADAGPFGEEGK